MRKVFTLPLLGLTSAVAACSGGSHATSGPIPAPVVSVAPHSGQAVTAALTLVIPQAPNGASVRTGQTRGRRYISPASLGAVLVATSTSGTAANDASYGYNLSPTGVCSVTGGVETCTLSFPLVADTYSIKITVYDHNEDGVTSGAGSPSAPIGNVLSTDTETETVVLGGNNAFNNFLLHGSVATFSLSGTTTFGAQGGTAGPSPIPSVQFAALDADGKNVDAYGSATTYANGPFTATVTQAGDTTGCTTPCVKGTNDEGTTTAGTATVAALVDDAFTLSYTGGGGPGSGVESYVAGTPPTGQQPYSGKLVVAGPGGSASATILPVFAYPTSLAITNGAVAYLWAAQAALPTGANTTTGSYSAYISAPGTSTCSAAAGGGTIVSIGTGTYYPGYGEVFPITPGVNGTCTVTLSDGGSPADTVSVPVTVGLPGSTVSVPCPQGTLPPTGSVIVRQRDASTVGPAPALVQYAVGVSQVTLPKPVTAGDTLVVIVGDNPGGPNLPSQYMIFDNATDDFGFVYTRDVGTTGSIGALSSGDRACYSAMWIGEFSGTASSSIQGANAGAGDTSNATTRSIVPNAQNGLLLTSFVSFDTAPATASTGFTEYFAYGPDTALDVQLRTAPTTDTTDPVSNTFQGAAETDGHAEILQIPPSTFVGTPSQSIDHNRAARLRAIRLVKSRALRN